MSTIQIHSHNEIEVKRPNGEIEIVRLDRGELSPREKDACIKNTKNAGRGDVIAIRSIKKAVPNIGPTAAEIASDKYHTQHAAIARMSAGGETDETSGCSDNTPAHKSDF